MRNSCVSRPAKCRLVIINEKDLEFTRGNACAAALISFFEHWHNIRLQQRQKAIEENDTREAHGDARTQNESLVQFHSLEQFEAGLLHTYRKDAIRSALSLLVELGVIEQFRNPNPRYSFDRTSHFLFHPEVLNKYYSDPEDGKQSIDVRKSADASAENQRPSAENQRPSAEISTAIQDKTKNITKEQKDIYIHRPALATKTPVLSIDTAPKEQQQVWFASWWETFWRKEGKVPAWKTFAKHITSEKRFEQLVQITQQRKPEMETRSVEHRKTPAAWLNTEPWNDLGETSPPQTAVATRIVNGANVARPSRKEEAAREFALRVLEANRG